MFVRRSVFITTVALRSFSKVQNFSTARLVTEARLPVKLVGLHLWTQNRLCIATFSWEGGLLDESAEDAFSSLTHSVEAATSQTEEVIENTPKSVEDVIEKNADSVTELIKGITKSANETINEGITSCKETGHKINEKLLNTVDSVTQQVAGDSEEAKTASAALIQKTACDLRTKADVFAGVLKGTDSSGEKSGLSVAKKSFGSVAEDSVRESPRNLVNEALRNLKTAAESTHSAVHDPRANENNVRGLQEEIITRTDILRKTIEELKFSNSSAIQQELALTLTTANAALREIVHDTPDSSTFSTLHEEINSTADILKKTVDSINSSSGGAIYQDLAVTLTTASAALREIVHDTSNVAFKVVMGGCATKGSADISNSVTTKDNPTTPVKNLTIKTNGNTEVIASQNRNSDQNKDNNKEEMPEIVEAVVCAETELKNGEMKEFPLGEEGNILLVKNEDGEFSALGTKCTHYGAPMVNGILYKGGIRCPWHAACFNSTTGDIEESPGLDSLPCYKVSILNGQVKVSAPKDLLLKNKRTKDMTSMSRQDPKVFAIIGGGAAGEACAETLREEGFKGRIVLMTAEDVRPYDRPKLSKAMHMTANEVALRNEVFYQNTDIEVWLNHKVSSVDIRKKLIKCTNGATLSYDKILIATGGRPRRLNIPGSDLENIYYLRTPDESNAILEWGKDKNVVVYGSSFIGMEVAAFMCGKADSVTVVARSPVPFINVFGKDIGLRYKTFFESKGITFETGTEIAEFHGRNGKVSAVVCKNGKVLPADIVVLGIGVIPATKFLRDSGIPVTTDGLIPVNEYLESSVEGVYAAGDIAEFPLVLYGNTRAHVAHWQIAQAHGRNAARNMVGKKEELLTVPFFWMVVLDKGIRYAGYGEGADDVVVEGDLEEMSFAAYHCKGEEVVAVISMTVLTAVNYAHYVQHGKKLTKSDVKNYPDCGWFKELG